MIYKTKTVNVVKPAIDGSNAPNQNTIVTYTRPAPPSGATFNGWTVTGGPYSVTGGTTSSTLRVTFTGAAVYTVSANYTMPGNRPFVISKTVAVMTPFIDGPDSPVINVDTDYLMYPLPGMSFFDWRILGGNYSVTGSTYNNTALKVKFTEAKTYTLTADYYLGGVPSVFRKH